MLAVLFQLIMTKINLSISINFESWFEKDREPKTKEEWQSFFVSHLLPESSILGSDYSDYQDMIEIHAISLDVVEFK